RRRPLRLQSGHRPLRELQAAAAGPRRPRVPRVAPQPLQPQPPASGGIAMRVVALAALLAALACAGSARAANGWWAFERVTNIDSTLSWKWTYPPSPAGHSRSWRAGSGTSPYECRPAEGWLPAGW